MRNTALLLVAGCVFVLPAQDRPARNPYNSPEDASAGGRIFRSHCAECHGLDGTGGRGPDVTSGRFRHGGTDADLYDAIDRGIPGSEMPGIYFEGRQIWQVVAYVRSLGQGAAEPQQTGDPARGEVLFSGQGGCAQCHRVQGRGGRSGPDLSDVGAKRNAKHLKTSLVEPNRHMSSRYFTVQGTTRDGRPIRGIRLNEDTHSLQILDSSERLISVMKSDLATYEIDKKSAMPSYQRVLGAADLDDLVAYLSTLRREGTRP